MRQDTTKLKEETIITNNTEVVEKKYKPLVKKKLKCQITDLNNYLFHEGKHHACYAFMGAHPVTEHRKKGIRFTTWAPNAKNVYVVGDFCNFEIREEYRMTRVTQAGILSIFIANAEPGMKYKYAIEDRYGKIVYKADPYAFESELRPATASIIVGNSDFKWSDRSWMMKRKRFNMYGSAINIYEIHLGSWRKDHERFLTYRELAEQLPEYLKDMGYTHVEIMPIMEHPLDGSWGYQTTGYYSVTSRYGTSDDFKYLIDQLHKANIGVILDWVPGHFCKDLHGLYMFDGTPTYEYAEGWKADNSGWGTYNFDLGRPEVKSFLISNVIYWMREFHIDGIRVDAVSNILYLDYGRQAGGWRPNKYGGNGNLEAIEFLKQLNIAVKQEFPTAMMIAEESTAWPKISRGVDQDGLGFDFKWNMGWMHDTLQYMKEDPLYRKYHHGKLTFSMMYNYSENFVLSISHDEVVHGKGSLINKMWGDYWSKFAQVRLYATHMIGHPGKKLTFMGTEFGQFIEWRDYEQLEWELIEKYDTHRNMHTFFKTLNNFYKENPALWKYDYDPKGYEWINADNSEESIFTFMRKTDDEKETLIFICNYTPLVYYSHRIGVPYLGEYKMVLDTDSKEFGGSGFNSHKKEKAETIVKSDKVAKSEDVVDANDETKTEKEVEPEEIDINMFGNIVAEEIPFDSQPYSIKIKIPPMAAMVLKVNNINKGK